MLKNLKILRNSKGSSQQQLADAIGVSQQSVNKYENHNIEPDIGTLIAIADFFETSVDYVIGNTDINKKIESVQTYDLNRDESALIDDYRKLCKKERESIKLIISNYIK